MTKNIHYSPELEVYVLGACMLEKTAMGRTYGIIEPECFWDVKHKKIYEVMKEMYNVGIPIDIVTVMLRMVEKDIYPTEAGWIVTSLTTSIVSTANLEFHCFLLAEMWKKRELLNLTKSGMDGSLDSREQVAHINKMLNNLGGKEFKKDWYAMDELMIILAQHHDDIVSGKKKFITTGFNALNRENGGFSEGQMIVIGARPSVGKSALMGKMAISMARENLKIGIISLEMNNVDIASRLTSLESNIEFWKINRNLFDDENQREYFYRKINDSTANLPIFISDKTKVDINEIRAKAAKLKYKHGLDCLMIDYLQLVDSSTENRQYNREQEVSKISRGLKLLAMDFQIPVIVLCQLNRSVIHRKGKERYPQLSDLRESGAIEQDSDIVMMLHRDWMSGFTENPETGITTERDADLLVVKWRNGALCHLPLEFEPQKMRFSERLNQPQVTHITPPKDEVDEFETF